MLWHHSWNDVTIHKVTSSSSWQRHKAIIMTSLDFNRLPQSNIYTIRSSYKSLVGEWWFRVSYCGQRQCLSLRNNIPDCIRPGSRKALRARAPYSKISYNKSVPRELKLYPEAYHQASSDLVKVASETCASWFQCSEERHPDARRWFWGIRNDRYPKYQLLPNKSLGRGQGRIFSAMKPTIFWVQRVLCPTWQETHQPYRRCCSATQIVLSDWCRFYPHDYGLCVYNFAGTKFSVPYDGLSGWVIIANRLTETQYAHCAV